MGSNDAVPSANDPLPLLLQKPGNIPESYAPSASPENFAGLTQEEMPSGIFIQELRRFSCAAHIDKYQSINMINTCLEFRFLAAKCSSTSPNVSLCLSVINLKLYFIPNFSRFPIVTKG